MNVDIKKTASHRRRTKIIATLGPATDDPEVLEGLIRAGVDVFRLNMSHGPAEEHERRARQVRQVARKLRWQVALLVDLPVGLQRLLLLRAEQFRAAEIQGPAVRGSGDSAS